MNDRSSEKSNPPSATDADNVLSPLPGEAGIPDVSARQRATVSRKALLAVALLITCVVAMLAASVQRLVEHGRQSSAERTQSSRDRPSAAQTTPRRLDLSSMPAASAPAPAVPRVPALVPTPADEAAPIGVHPTGDRAAGPTSSRDLRPEDAPVMIVTGHARGDRDLRSAEGSNEPASDPSDSMTRSLQHYQQRLQGLMDSLSKGAPATGVSRSTSGPGSEEGSVGVPHAGTESHRVTAHTLANRSLTLPQGTAFTCALKTKVVSATSGLIGCQVQRNVYSEDGRVLLIERGSHLDGEYQAASIRPGTVRIPVVWTRLRTPSGVVADIGSPGTGALGESGIDGAIDNRWGERIGAALLLSLIDDSVQMVIQGQSSEGQPSTVILPTTTANSGKLAEKVLDSTINIPPLLYRNQGGIVGIYVAHDVDFSTVYDLVPTALEPAASAPVESGQ